MARESLVGWARALVPLSDQVYEGNMHTDAPGIATGQTTSTALTPEIESNQTARSELRISGL